MCVWRELEKNCVDITGYCVLFKGKWGLGVRDLECFNKALVIKWLWRFLTCKNSLWVRVISSLHGTLFWGEEGIFPEGRESRWSNWWRNIVSLGRGRTTDDFGRI